MVVKTTRRRVESHDSAIPFNHGQLCVLLILFVSLLVLGSRVEYESMWPESLKMKTNNVHKPLKSTCYLCCYLRQLGSRTLSLLVCGNLPITHTYSLHSLSHTRQQPICIYKLWSSTFFEPFPMFSTLLCCYRFISVASVCCLPPVSASAP